MTLKNIVWLASYPKSGNTWMRIFLSNYLLARDAPVGINQIQRLGLSDASTEFYRKVCKGPFDPADHMLTLRLRGKVLRGVAGNRADINFVKTHNMNETVFGVPLIPVDLTRAAVHIIRDPLDVAVSYARHFGYPPEQAVSGLCRSDNTTAGTRGNVKQYLGSWSEHVQSWADERRFPLHTVRYEDMLSDPEKSFSAVLNFIGIPIDAERLATAIANSSFEALQRQEAAEPFVERSDKSERFFHTGRAGQWQDALDDAQVARLRTAHAAVMQRFGYL